MMDGALNHHPQALFPDTRTLLTSSPPPDADKMDVGEN